MTPYKVLVLAPNPWRSQWVNRQQFFSRLGRQRPVLYSNGGLMAWQWRTPQWRSAAWLGGVTELDHVAVDEPPRWLVRAPRFPRWDKIAIALQCRRWRELLEPRGAGPLVAYVFHPMFEEYLDALRAERIVYHAYDLFDHTPGWNEHLDRSERRLIERAHRVIASSDQIGQGLAAKGARDVQTLPNGADFVAIAAAAAGAAPLPNDLARIPRPRIGWVGSLHPEVDFALIADMAQARPRHQFVLVGAIPELKVPRAEADRERCRAMPNVHFLGGRETAEVPAYIAGMDVNMMCYRVSGESWIKAGYPLKLHEYLAAGHPVLSADLAVVREFAAVVRIASGRDDWLAALDDALAGRGQGTREERQRVAAANTWDQRVKTLDGWLTALVGGG